VLQFDWSLSSGLAERSGITKFDAGETWVAPRHLNFKQILPSATLFGYSIASKT